MLPLTRHTTRTASGPRYNQCTLLPILVCLEYAWLSEGRKADYTEPATLCGVRPWLCSALTPPQPPPLPAYRGAPNAPRVLRYPCRSVVIMLLQCMGALSGTGVWEACGNVRSHFNNGRPFGHRRVRGSVAISAEVVFFMELLLSVSVSVCCAHTATLEEC